MEFVGHARSVTSLLPASHATSVTYHSQKLDELLVRPKSELTVRSTFIFAGGLGKFEEVGWQIVAM
jgi:hypothetical protein